MAEYAYNNSVTSATGLSPFFANYGRHPETLTPREINVQYPGSEAYAHWMQKTIEDNSEALKKARERMEHYVNKSRSAAPAYKVGDPVMLNGRHIKTRRPCRNLDHKYHGPFQVERIMSPTAVRLTLPIHWKIHPTFHVSEVEPHVHGSRNPPDFAKVLREAEEIEADEEFDMESVEGSIIRRNRVLYHVKWLGWPRKKDWTYEPFENFSIGGLEKIKQFHLRKPDAPRDYRIST